VAPRLWLWIVIANSDYIYIYIYIHRNNCFGGFSDCLLNIDMLQYYIKGHHKQLIQIYIIFNYMHVCVGLPQPCVYNRPQKYNFPATAPPVLERLLLIIVMETCSWNSKMKHAVKYDVYLDTLFMVSIYVIKYWLLRSGHQTKHIIFGPGSISDQGPSGPGTSREPNMEKGFPVPNRCFCICSFDVQSNLLSRWVRVQQRHTVATKHVRLSRPGVQFFVT